MKKTEKGFTIIEVALVLAIGALIFLVVFLAVPALQRNQRNDARKRDISNVVEAVSDYSSNNPGTQLEAGKTQYEVGSNLGNALTKYIDTLSNSTDKVVTSNSGQVPDSNDNANTDTITVQVGYRCNGLSSIVKGTMRQSAVLGVMEQSGGKRSVYCQDAS